MADAKCCDVCGKFYRVSDGMAINLVRPAEEFKNGYTIHGYGLVLELCDECAMKVLAVIGKNKEDLGW